VGLTYFGIGLKCARFFRQLAYWSASEDFTSFHPISTSEGLSVKFYSSLLILAVSMLLSTHLAFADTSHCTVITSLPNTISSPGVYCLTQDLTYTQGSGAAVTIAADGVTLDLNGHALRYTDTPGPGSSSIVGVSVSGHYYFSIIDGTIAGFFGGISVGSAQSKHARGGLIADLKIQRNTEGGIFAQCDGCVIRDNMITDTTIPASYPPLSGNPYALQVFGNGNLVTGNRVYNTNPQAHTSAYAIYIDAQNSTVSNNYVANDQIDITSAIYGIWVADGNNLVTANQVQNMANCFWFVGTSAKYRDNLTANCIEDFGGGTGGVLGFDMGGNN
jgi:hypothetical protein